MPGSTVRFSVPPACRALAVRWCFRRVRHFDLAGFRPFGFPPDVSSEALRPTSTPPEPESRQRPFTISERRLSVPFGGQSSRPADFNSAPVRSPDPFGSRLLRSALVSRPSQGVIHTRNPFSVPLPNAAALVSRPHSPSGQRPSGSKRSACHRPANSPPFPFPVPLATVP